MLLLQFNINLQLLFEHAVYYTSIFLLNAQLLFKLKISMEKGEVYPL